MPHPSVNPSEIFFQKLKCCPCDLYFISPLDVTAVQLSRPVAHQFNWSPLQEACRTIFGAGRYERALAASAWDVVDRLGAELSVSSSLKHPAIRVLRDDPSGNTYFALVASPSHLPLAELLPLLNRLQIQQGHIPLHACGVIHCQSLFLFCGESGSGKSTIASLSTTEQDDVLDDDQVLLLRELPHCYTACAWSGPWRCSTTPLRAILNLVKDSHTFLQPVDSLCSTHFLLDRVFDLHPEYLPPAVQVLLISMIADLANDIPSYELHFRKTVDFWDVIDAASIPSIGNCKPLD